MGSVTGDNEKEITHQHCYLDGLKYFIHRINGGKNIIIGDGLMAKSFLGMNLDRKIVIFASGVSNSNEQDASVFDKEKKLFLHINKEFPDYTIVYFSSPSIFDPGLQDRPYVQHKKDMESLISSTSSLYCILRLPTIVGKSTNPNTLVNNIYNNIINEKPFDVRKNAKRYLIDVDDVYDIVCNMLADKGYTDKVIDVALFQYTILDIVQMLEKITGKSAVYALVDKGGAYDINTSVVNYISHDTQKKSSATYLELILKKYYHKA